MTISDNVRQVAFLTAAGFIGTALVIAAASPAMGRTPIQEPVTVIAKKEVMTERVPYGDLSLATREGRGELYHRVGLAVNRVCPSVDDLGFAIDPQGCQDFAWDGARPQMHRAIKAAKSGASLAMTITITAAAPTK